VRVCFVLPSLRRSGGVAVATAFARWLRSAHEVDAELVVLERGGAEPDGVPVVAIHDARGRPYDIAVATWWETIGAAASLDADRRCVLLQSFEQRFYGPDAPFERLAAEATLSGAASFVAVSAWIRDLLLQLRPGAACAVVRPGVDKEVFAGGRARREGPLRVLIDGQPTLPFKGVAEAVAAVQAMAEPVRSTLVALDPATAGDVAVDEVVGGLDPAGMAALYRDHDVLVKLSRVEGLGLAPVEGFHSGLPCVVTPYTGSEEYARHGENALVVGFDDVPGTAAALDRLARDRDLLARLGAGALATAADWPSVAESGAALHAAFEEILAGEVPAADERLLRATVELGTALGRARSDRGRAATEEALTHSERLVRELSASRDECGEMLEEAKAELARIKGSPAYRLGSAAKRAGQRITRR
jgi:O-antigen biosynthesis protein